VAEERAELETLAGIKASEEAGQYLRKLAKETGYPVYTISAIALDLGVAALQKRAPGFLEEKLLARMRRRPRRRLT
jgi:hypothetical protein